MADLKKRALGFLIGIDEAFNAAGGGEPTQTISGTIGRGLQRGYWWAPAARKVVDAIFGQGHCVNQAVKEAVTDGID